MYPEAGQFRVMVSGGQPDKRSQVLAGSTVLDGKL